MKKRNAGAEMTPVLLIDDLPELRALVRDLLESEGYPVAEARNGREALDILRSSQVPMVAIFGTTIGTSLLQTAADEPAVIGRHAFVLLTAYPEGLTPRWQVLLKSLGVPVVPKPFDLDALLDAVAGAAARITQQGGEPVPA